VFNFEGNAAETLPTLDIPVLTREIEAFHFGLTAVGQFAGHGLFVKLVVVKMFGLGSGNGGRPTHIP